MAEIKVVDDRSVENFCMVGGFPGLGLIASITSSFLIDELEMDLYAKIYSEETLGRVTFDQDEYEVNPAICIYMNDEHELLLMKSDVPISGHSQEFVQKLTSWTDDRNITQIHLLGLETMDKEDGVFAVTTGEASKLLENTDIRKPPNFGGVGGPSGALLEEADRRNMDSIALVVGVSPYFPDPEAAEIIIQEGLNRILDRNIRTEELSDAGEEIKEKQDQLTSRIEEIMNEETGRAYPQDMYGSN